MSMVSPYGDRLLQPLKGELVQGPSAPLPYENSPTKSLVRPVAPCICAGASQAQRADETQRLCSRARTKGEALRGPTLKAHPR